MTTSQEMNSCVRRAWIAAAIIGVLVLLIMMLAAGWGFWGALVLGLVAFVVCGIVLPRMFCPPQAAEHQSFAPAPAPASAPAAPQPSAAPTPSPDSAPETAPEAAPVAAPAPEPAPEADSANESASAPASEAMPASDASVAATGPLVRTGTLLAGETEVANRKGSWRYGGEPSQAPADAPEVATASTETGADETRPAALSGPREGRADNLKAIKGVGPKLEAALHDIGIYHFDQIAGWTAEEVTWADGNLVGFKGRVSRDNWVDQARTLAEGGETEFSKRVGKGEVY